MEIRLQSLKFNADQKLIAHVEKKVGKLEKFDETITGVDVVLSLMEKPENKNVQLQVHVPGETLVVEKAAKTFEEAVNECVDVMRENIVRSKEKRYA